MVAEQHKPDTRYGGPPHVIVDVADSHVEEAPDSLVITCPAVRHGDHEYTCPPQKRVFAANKLFNVLISFFQPTVHHLRRWREEYMAVVQCMCVCANKLDKVYGGLKRIYCI